MMMKEEPRSIYAPLRRVRDMKYTHPEKRRRSYLRMYWITYLVIVLPLSIASMIVDMQPYSNILLLAQYIALFGNFAFLFIDIKQSSRRHKMWMGLMDEKIKVMREGTWSEEDRKKIAEIDKKMEQYES